MARYTKSVCRQCRREGEKLYLKGERCYSDKCALERKPYPPGDHGRGRRKASEYGIQLREKQKVRRAYGLMEKQFSKYMQMAERKPGVTGDNFLTTLERRLDNVVYRMGFATSRKEARQLVRHGHITLNGRRHDIPSYLVREDDRIAVKEKSKKLKRMQEIVETTENQSLPSWLEADFENLTGRVLGEPEREDIDLPIKESLIVEYYSR